MKRIKLFCLVALCSCASLCFAQKENVHQAEAWVTSSKVDFPKARKLIGLALENKETKDEVKTWYVAGLVEFRSFELDKDKKAHKEKVNEETMYAALLSAYTYWKKAYLIDLTPDVKGKIKPKYLKRIKAKLLPNYPYLGNGGQDAFNSGKYQEAYQYFDAYVSIVENELFFPKNPPKEENLPAIRFYRAKSASLAGDHGAAIRCFEEIKEDSFEAKSVYSFLCLELEQVGDTLRWEKTIIEAIKKFPNELDFQKSLINRYMFTNRTEEALSYLDKALEKEPTSTQMWGMKGYIYEEQNDYKRAKKFYTKALDLAPEDYDCLVNMGRLHYNIAVQENDEINAIKTPKEYKKAKKKVDELYRKALPYFEKAHSVNPKGKDAMIGLRGIYYKLAMGEKYDEMEYKLKQIGVYDE